MRMQVGANEGQVLEIRIPEISAQQMRLQDVNVKTQEDANKAIANIDFAIKYVSNARSRLGAYQNRLEHTEKNIDITSENMTGAYSRIMDTDMAEEMTNYSKNNILMQAGQSMLAQANQSNQGVLSLLG